MSSFEDRLKILVEESFSKVRGEIIHEDGKREPFECDNITFDKPKEVDNLNRLYSVVEIGPVGVKNVFTQIVVNHPLVIRYYDDGGFITAIKYKDPPEVACLFFSLTESKRLLTEHMLKINGFEYYIIEYLEAYYEDL